MIRLSSLYTMTDITSTKSREVDHPFLQVSFRRLQVRHLRRLRRDVQDLRHGRQEGTRHTHAPSGRPEGSLTAVMMIPWNYHLNFLKLTRLFNLIKIFILNKTVWLFGVNLTVCPRAQSRRCARTRPPTSSPPPTTTPWRSSGWAAGR